MGACTEHQATIYAEMSQKQIIFWNIVLTFDTGKLNRSVNMLFCVQLTKAKFQLFMSQWLKIRGQHCCLLSMASRMKVQRKWPCLRCFAHFPTCLTHKQLLQWRSSFLNFQFLRWFCCKALLTSSPLFHAALISPSTYQFTVQVCHTESVNSANLKQVEAEKVDSSNGCILVPILIQRFYFLDFSLYNWKPCTVLIHFQFQQRPSHFWSTKLSVCTFGYRKTAFMRLLYQVRYVTPEISPGSDF